MKNVVKSSLLALVTCILIGGVAGCKNFLNSQGFVEELENSLAYAQASYADVTINTASSATEYISPAAGNYNKNYKITDSIDLSFTPKSSYQFVKWIATPEDSVAFEDAAQTKTKATIVKADSPITIEPQVYERPTVTVSPGNSVENPRNSAIVISFSEAMSVSDEDLSLIGITVDDISALENFEAPAWNEEKTKVTFIPKRDNLIQVGSVAKVVKVTVPESFNYEKDGVKVTLEEDFSYSFRINSTTETKVNISVSCPASEGDLSYSGIQTYYLDETLSVTCTPNSAYVLAGWDVLYEDGTKVEENILQKTVSDNLLTINLKVLTGATEAVKVTPVLVKKGVLTVDFSCEKGAVSPSDQKTYYKGDEFSIRYTEAGDYAFTGWVVTDVNDNPVDDVIEIKRLDALETTCKVLKTDTKILIKANSSKRPQVLAMTPAYENAGVDRDSNIRIIFSQPMSYDSIYYTLLEARALGLSSISQVSKVTGVVNSEGQQLYNFYKDNSKTNVIYKNITIKNRVTGEDISGCYDVPFYTSEDNTILVIPSKKTGYADAGIDIEVIISSEFTNKDNVNLSSDFSGCFFTNGTTDSLGPSLVLTELVMEAKLSTVNKSASKTYDLSTTTGLLKDANIPVKAVNEITPDIWEQAPWSNALRCNGYLDIKLTGKIIDGGSKPDKIEVQLIPVVNLISDEERASAIYTVSKLTPPGEDGQTCDFSENPLLIRIKTTEVKYEGGYKLKITGYDKRGNTTQCEYVFPYILDKGNTPVGISDADLKYSHPVIMDKYFEDFTVKLENHPGCWFGVVVATTNNGITPDGYDYIPAYQAYSFYNSKFNTEGYRCKPSYNAGNNEWIPGYFWCICKDIFGRTSTKRVNNEIKYGDVPKITSYEVTFVKLLNIHVSEECSGLSKIYINLSIDNNPDYSEHPTVFTLKIDTAGQSNTYSYSQNEDEPGEYVITLTNPVIASDISVQVKLNCGIQSDETYDLTFWVEDANGNKSAAEYYQKN